MSSPLGDFHFPEYVRRCPWAGEPSNPWLRELGGGSIFIVMFTTTSFAFGFEFAVTVGLATIYAKASVASPPRR